MSLIGEILTYNSYGLTLVKIYQCLNFKQKKKIFILQK